MKSTVRYQTYELKKLNIRKELFRRKQKKWILISLPLLAVRLLLGHSSSLCCTATRLRIQNKLHSHEGMWIFAVLKMLEVGTLGQGYLSSRYVLPHLTVMSVLDTIGDPSF